MKKNYHAPNADTVRFDLSDILTASSTEEETTTAPVTTAAPLPGDRFDSDAFPPKA